MNKNKGMLLEKIINQTNERYALLNLALIHKKNLDIKFKQVVKKDKKLLIEDAKIVQKSTVDYYGIYRGKFIAFEAKECEGDTFSYQNIRKHQIEYLDLINRHQGCGFYIIFFKKYDVFYWVKSTHLHTFFEKKRSLKMSDLDKIGNKLELIFPGVLNYLDFIY
ncbi:Holliday junction resolvase RecU [Mycoplasma sp. 4044]